MRSPTAAPSSSALVLELCSMAQVGGTLALIAVFLLSCSKRAARVDHEPIEVPFRLLVGDQGKAYEGRLVTTTGAVVRTAANGADRVEWISVAEQAFSGPLLYCFLTGTGATAGDIGTGDRIVVVGRKRDHALLDCSALVTRDP